MRSVSSLGNGFAQRLSASRQQEPGASCPCPSSCHPCAQRLAASRQQEPHHASAGRVRLQVLNAFQHHGNRNRLTRSRSRSRSSRCAQRLSASRQQEPARRSLPAGLRVLRAQRLSASRQQEHAEDEDEHVVEAVLNAFRHHGNRNRTSRSRSVRRSASAQRLSASRQQEPPRSDCSNSRCGCAQRLSASRQQEQGISGNLVTCPL